MQLFDKILIFVGAIATVAIVGFVGIAIERHSAWGAQMNPIKYIVRGRSAEGEKQSGTLVASAPDSASMVVGTSGHENGDVTWLSPTEVHDRSGRTSVATTCRPRQSHLTIGHSLDLNLTLKTTYVPPKDKESADNCHLELTVLDSDGNTVFQKEGDYGQTSDITTYTDFGITSLVPGTEQLVISEMSCGASCDGEFVKLLSFNTGNVAEIIHFPGDELQYPSEADRDLKWEIRGHKLHVSSSWYIGDKLIKPMKIAISFSPATDMPVLPASRDELSFYSQLTSSKLEASQFAGGANSSAPPLSRRVISATTTCAEFTADFRAGYTDSYIQYAAQQFVEFDRQRVADGKTSIGIPRPALKYWADLCGGAETTLGMSSSEPFYNVIASYYSQSVNQDCAFGGCR